MSWTSFEKKLSETRFDFTEEQLKNLKMACTNLYEILKFVFDSPRRLYKPYTSLTRYKFEKERLYTSPSDFYSFRYNDVLIQIHFRQNRFYSIGVYGMEFPELEKEPKLKHETVFSNGFHYYGHFSRNEFKSCVMYFENLCFNYVKTVINERGLF